MIKFVYFDIGGVLIKDFSKTDKWSEVLDVIKVPDSKRNGFNEHFFQLEHEICSGLNTNSAFTKLARQFGIVLPKDFNLLYEIAIRFEKNESIWSIAKLVKSKVKVGLLTNMYSGMLDEIKQRKLLPKIKWDIVVDSSVEGCSKPEKEIFEIAQKRALISGEEIFYIENTQRHIDAAKKLGWKTFLYDSADYESSSNKLLECFDGLLA